MVNYMEELSVTEAENLKKTISALFRQTCILQVKYDPVTLTPRDNLHYEICVRHRKFIEDYLSVLGCELVHDPQEHIFRLTGEGVAVERLNVTATKIILLIKIIYRDKILGEGLMLAHNIQRIFPLCHSQLLIDQIRVLSILTDLRQIRHSRIQTFTENLIPIDYFNKKNDQTKIYIYSTINLYCSGVDIQALMKEYVDEEGGAEVEAGEEDIYKNADE